MSSYENYARTSRRYDSTRIAAGWEVIAGFLADCETPRSQQHLLDAGCGTANYARALRGHVHRLSAADLNAEMLARARAKCADNHIDFFRASISELPFRSATFDAVMINQVLHHLPLRAEDGYPVYKSVFKEIARVLKPGGVLSVNTCSRAQLQHGFWYYDLFPDAVARMCARHAPPEVLRALLNDAGMQNLRCVAPPEILMQGDSYFNARGPLDPSWRAGDSIWSTLFDEELQAACARVAKLDAAGELENYMFEKDAPRKKCGQLSFLQARRL